MFCRKDFLRNFTIFRRKHLCYSLFFNEIAGLRPAILLKERLWHKCFPVNFAKFLRTPFLQNTSGNCFCSDILNSQRQTYDISRKSISKQDKLVELLDLCPKQKNHPMFSYDWFKLEMSFAFFLSNNQQLHNLKQFCFGKCCYILGVDPTFNSRNYNATISTYRHPLLIDKATEEQPVLMGLSIIHSHKTFQSNFLLASKYGLI